MENKKMKNSDLKILRILLILLILVQTISCTHWIVGSTVRIQMENLTDEVISDLSVVSEKGHIVLVPEILGSREKSRVHEVEWAGEFPLAIFVDGSRIELGTHKLKAGSVFMQINPGFVVKIR